MEPSNTHPPHIQLAAKLRQCWGPAQTQDFDSKMGMEGPRHTDPGINQHAAHRNHTVAERSTRLQQPWSPCTDPALASSSRNGIPTSTSVNNSSLIGAALLCQKEDGGDADDKAIQDPRSSSDSHTSPCTDVDHSLVRDKNTETEPAVDCDQRLADTSSTTVDQQLSTTTRSSLVSQASEEFRLDLDDKIWDSVYRYHGAPNLFVAYEHKIGLPDAKRQEWVSKPGIRERLWRDVLDFERNCIPIHKRKRFNRNPRPAFSVDCRMSGYATKDGKQVVLHPTIWINYRKDRAKQVRELLESLKWLPGAGFGDPEVREGGLMLLSHPISESHPISMEKLGLLDQEGHRITENIELFVHFESPESVSVGGLLCCATFLKNCIVDAQHLSKIGGVINLRTRTSEVTRAVTTAHGLWQGILQYVETDGDAEEQREHGSSSSSLSSAEEDQDEESTNTRVTSTLPEDILGAVGPHELQSITWVQLPVSTIQETSFLETSGINIEDWIRNQSQPHTGTLPESAEEFASLVETTTRDLSFLDIPGVHDLRNYYEGGKQKDPGALEPGVVQGFAKPDELTTGYVSILLRPEKPISGMLISASNETYVSLYGRLIRVCKIELDAPLGEFFLSPEVCKQGRWH